MEVDIVDKCICLCAKRKSGKSRLLRYILTQNKDNFDAVFLFCPTETINNFYKGLIEPKNMFSKYDDEWTGKLFEKMSKLNANSNEKDESEFKRCLVILDDITASERFNSHQNFPNFYSVFKKGRHVGISFILTTQYPKDLPIDCRSNCDWFMCGQLNTQALNILTEEFMMGKITKSQFEDMYYRCTSNFNFLVINTSNVKDNTDLNSIYGVLRCPDEFVK